MLPNPNVHRTALIGPNVTISKSARVGAYSIVGIDDPSLIVIADDVRIGHHCILSGNVNIARRVQMDAFTRIQGRVAIGDDTRLLYGARVHDEVRIGCRAVIAGNCPDNTSFGDDVIHLGRISHGFHFPFSDWDEPAEIGPTLESRVVVGTDANIIGPITIGTNTLIFPREIVRTSLPGNGVFLRGEFKESPNWSNILRILGKSGWAEKRKASPVQIVPT